MPNKIPNNDDFAHVFMFRGNDDDIIMHPYWTQLSSPCPYYDWDDMHLDEMAVYFPFFSVSTIKPDDKDIEWRIEYQRRI